MAGSIAFDGNQVILSSPVYGGSGMDAITLSLDSAASGSTDSAGPTSSQTPAGSTFVDSAAATTEEPAPTQGGSAGTAPTSAAEESSSDGPSALTQELLQLDENGLPLPQDSAQESLILIGGNGEAASLSSSQLNTTAASPQSDGGEQLADAALESSNFDPGSQNLGVTAASSSPSLQLLPNSSTSSGTSTQNSASSTPAKLVIIGDGNWQSHQSGGTATGQGTLISSAAGDLILREGDSFLLTASRDYTIPANPGTLEFTYDALSFDANVQGQIRDAFEVALLGPDGASLVHAFADDRDAFFNLTDGQQVAYGTGVTLDGQKVTLDISAIAPGTTATLVFRLLNNDGDTGSTVTIKAGQRPTVTAGLLVDTAPSGPGTDAYRSDLLTSICSVTGTVDDDNGVIKLEGRIDGGDWDDITDDLSDNSFTWDPGTLAIGPHTVEIRAQDRAGLYSDIAVVQFAVNTPPTASAGADLAVAEGTQVALDASGSTDPEGLHSYTWDLPGGATATGAVTTYRFVDQGSYPVTANVTDTAGEIRTDELTITVTNANPVVSVPELAGEEGQALTLTASFTDAGINDIHTATIDWGDGSALQTDVPVTEANGSGTVTASHSYADNGSYTMTVTVNDADNGSGQGTGTATITNVSPTAILSNNGPKPAGVPVIVQFGNAQDPSSADMTAGLRYSFADVDTELVSTWQDSSTTGSYQRTFSVPGVYIIHGRVIDKNQGYTDYETVIAVEGEALTVVASPISGNEGADLTLSASFTDLSTSISHTATIYWGDGTSSTGIVTETTGGGAIMASHRYGDDKTYTIGVQVTGDAGVIGAGATIATIANVDPTLHAGYGFRADSSSGQTQLAVTLQGRFTDPGFTNSAADTAETFTVVLNWGDGTTSTLTPTTAPGDATGHLTTGTFWASHVYSTWDIYPLAVTVHDDDGGQDQYQTSLGIASIKVNADHEINLKSRGTIDVTFRQGGTYDFETNVNASQLRFGPAGTHEVNNAIGSNGVMQFDNYRTGIQPEDQVAFLTGTLNDNTPFVAMDMIAINAASLNGHAGITPGTTKYFVVDAGTVTDQNNYLYHTIFGYGTDGSETSNSIFETTLLGEEQNGDPILSGPTGIAANHDGSRLWTIDRSTGKVLVYNSSAKVIGSWHAAGLVDAQGITTNQVSSNVAGDIWVVDASLHQVLWFDSNAALTTSGQVPGIPLFELDIANDHPSDIVTIDGSLFWVLQNNTAVGTADQIFVYDASGTPLANWTLDAANTDARGLTLDPNLPANFDPNLPNNLTGSAIQVVDAGTHQVYTYASGTSLVIGQHAAASSFTLANGADNDNAQPEAIADPPVNAAGTDFWTASYGSDSSIGIDRFLISNASSVATSGTIEIPGINPGPNHYTLPFSVIANGTTEVLLPSTVSINGQSYSTYISSSPTTDITASRAIHITSTQPVTIQTVRQVWPMRGDGMLLLPTTALGTQYYYVGTGAAGTYATSIGIVATTPEGGGETTVWITPTNTTADHPAGEEFHITLQPGQAYISAYNNLDLTGSFIRSNRRIALISDGYSYPQALAEQIPAITSWGTDFYAVATPDSSGGSYGDTFKIVASQSSTTLTIERLVNGVRYTSTPTLQDAGDFVTVMSSQAVRIMSDDPTKPVLVAQITNPNRGSAVFAAGAMMLVPPINGYQDRYVVEVPNASITTSFNHDYIDVLVPPDAVASFRYDNQSVSLTSFPDGDQIAENDYRYARIPTTDGRHTLTADAPFGAWLYSWHQPTGYSVPGSGFAVPAGMGDLLGGVTLSLSPGLVTKTVGTYQTFTATVLDLNGDPVAGKSVHFSVSGTNTASSDPDPVTDSAGRATFRYRSTLTGPDTITATCLNLTQTASITWTAVNAPTISITTPADGATRSTAAPTLITGQATAGDPTVPIVSVTLNGRPVDALDSTGRFFARVTLAPGANTLTFLAVDAQNRIATTTRTLTGAATPPPDFDNLTDQTSRVALDHRRTSLDNSSDLLYTDIALRNTGVTALSGRLLLVLTSISRDNVTLATYDGITPDGNNLYLDVTSLLAGQTLAAGATTTDALTLAFHNPDGTPFTFSYQLLASGNALPEFTSVPVLDAYVGRQYTYAAAADDPTVLDTLQWSLTSAPISDPAISSDDMQISSAGLVTWTPRTEDIGTYSIVIAVADGLGGTAYQSYLLTVHATPANQPPVFTSTPITRANVNQHYSYTLAAEDPDQDDLTYELVSGPLGLTLLADGVTLSYDPVFNDRGDHPITVSVTDGNFTATQSFTLRVGPDLANHPPVITTTPAPRAVIAGNPFLYDADAYDPDGDSLNWSYTATDAAGQPVTLPPSAFNTTTGLLDWTTTTSDAGPLTLQLTVTDSATWSDTQLFTLDVLPAATLPATITGHVYRDTDSNGILSHDEADSLNGIAGYDVYLDTNSNGRRDTGEPQQTTNSEGGYAFTDLAPGDYLVRLAPKSGYAQSFPAAGPLSVTLAAGQTAGQRSFAARNLTAPTNHAPVILAPAAASIEAGHALTLTPTILDPDGDTLTLSLDSPPAGAFLENLSPDWRLSPNFILYTTLDQADTTQTITFRATETNTPEQLSTTYTLTLSITPSTDTGTPDNHHPRILSSAPLTANLGSLYTYTVRAFDTDGDQLSLSLLAGPGDTNPDPNIDNSMIILEDGWTIAWTPTAPSAPQTVELLVSDGHGGSTTQPYDLTIVGQSSNNAPFLITPAKPNAPVGHEYRYFIHAGDLDGDELTYTLLDPATGMPLLETDMHLIDTDADGRPDTLAWTPSADDYPNPTLVPVSIAISDGLAAINYTFNLDVHENHAPVLNAMTYRDVSAGETIAYTLPAFDPDRDDLSFIVESTDLPLNAAGQPSYRIANGTLIWSTTPAMLANQPTGGYQITLRAKDEWDATSASQTLRLQLVPDTTPPEVTIYLSVPYIIANFDLISDPEISPPEVGFSISASDNVALDYSSMQVMMGDDPETATPIEVYYSPEYDSWHGAFPVASYGQILLTATVNDLAGNEGSATATFGTPSATPPQLNITAINGQPVTTWNPDSDDPAPTTTPLTITAPVTITGFAFAQDPSEFGQYSLELLSTETGARTLLAQSSTPISSAAALATLDPTTLPNGPYTLSLTVSTVFTVNGQELPRITRRVQTNLEIAGQAKVGNFRFSETDLAIPIAGLPLTLTRSYDTLNASRNSDFGYGWSWDLDYAIREVAETRTTYPVVTAFDYPIAGTHSASSISIRTGPATLGLGEGGWTDPSRDVWITLPSGQRVRYAFYIDTATDTARFRPTTPGVTATLAIDGNDRLHFEEGPLGNYYYWDELGPDAGDYFEDGSLALDPMALYAKYDIPGYRLTLADGTVLRFAKTESDATRNAPMEVYYDANATADADYTYVRHTYLNDLHLDSITDSSGNTLTITRNPSTGRVLSLSGANLSLTFQRDAQGRITGAYAPAANPADPPVLMVRYAYTPAGDLDHVDRLIDATAATEDEQWQTTTYHYQHLANRSTHKITSLTSDSGKTPILNEYDPTTGKLIATVDRFGHRIVYTHNPGEEVVQDRNGTVTIYQYDTLGNVTRQNVVTHPTTAQAPATGEVTEYEYTDPANPTQETSITTGILSTYHPETQTWTYDDSNAFTTSYSYDAQGNKTSESYTVQVDGQPATMSQSWYYETIHNRQVLRWFVDQQGIRTESDYDPSGNLTATLTLDRTGHLLSQTTFSDYVQGQPRVTTSFGVPPSGGSPTPSTRSVSTFNSHGYLTDSYQQVYAGTDPLDPNRHLWTTTARTRYSVDQRGNLTATTQYQPTQTPSNPTSGLTEAELNQNWTIALPATTTDYDQLGRPYLTTTYTGLPDDPATHEREDYLMTSTLYNEDGQVWRSYDARNNYSETEYDELGQVIATRSYAADGMLLSTSRTTYTADGQVATSTDALGNATSSYYDTTGRSVRTVSPDGTSSETLYDSAGRAYLSIDRHLATQTSGLYGSIAIYDNAGRTVETRRLSGVTIVIDQDDTTHQASVALPTGVDASALPYLSHTQTFYNALGQVWKSVDATGTATWYLYDAAGRQTDTIQAVDVDQNGTVDATDTNSDTIPDTGSERLVTHTDYDSLGRAYRTTDANNHTTITQYDDQGRVSRTVFHDNSFIAYGYDAMGRKLWQSDQLAAGSTEAQIEASKTRYEYDDRGNLTAVVLPAVADPENSGAMTHPRYEYTYDSYGNQLTQKDANGRVTTFEYDPLTGQQTARVLPLGQREETGYDILGRTAWVRDLAGRTTVFAYDSLGRLQTKTFFAAGKDPATATPDKLLTYHYDELGRVDSIADSVDGVTSYQYDPEGRQTQLTTPQGTINYQYDTLGRLDRTWTSNTDVRYSYDALSRLQTVTMVTRAGQAVAGPTLDWYGQTISGETTRYRYDPVGNLDLIQQSNGVVSDYTYNSLNRLKDLVHFTDTNGNAVQEPGEATLASFHYELNADGNKSSAAESDDQGITRTFSWRYDALDRLVSESLLSTDAAQNYITRWTMDLVGNRLQQETDQGAATQAISDFTAMGSLTPDEIRTYGYDENDRLEWEQNDSAGAADDTYTLYSWNAGDQTGKSVHAGLTDAGAVTEQTSFTYNVQGRTATITITKDGQTTQITYKYNVDGIRVEESTTVNGTTATKTYLIDANNFTGYAQVLEEFVNGQLAKTFTLGHDVLTQHDAANGALTFLYDGHGSTRSLLDALAGMIQRYAYQAYGQLLDGQGLTAAIDAAITSLLYSGEKTDGFGGQDLRDRIYEIATGRFTQFDRYRDARSLHKYTYANASPINNVDPSGQLTMGEMMLAIGKQLLIRAVDLGLRIAPTAIHLSFNAMYIALRVWAAIPAFLAYTTLGLFVLEVGSGMIINLGRNDRPINEATGIPRPGEVTATARGRLVEEYSGANLRGTVQGIDDFRKGVATSIRSHRTEDATTFLNVVKQDLRDLMEKTRTTIRGQAHNGEPVIIQPSAIQARQLVVVVQEGNQVVRDSGVLRQLQAWAEEYQVTIRPAVCRLWRVR